VIYGEALTPSGPVGSRATRSGKDIVVEFKDVQGQLKVLGAREISGFQVCGSAGSRNCEFATAVPDGTRVRISGGRESVRVRYCWADSPICTLYDGSGLPAGPFELPIQ
jgi:sialate O-acetylesterase